MIQVFKAVKGISRVNADDWFDLKDVENMRPTRANTMITESGESKKLYVMNQPSCRLDVWKNFFTVRIVNEWNALPEAAKNATTTNAFKNTYDKFQMSKNSNLEQVDAT